METESKTKIEFLQEKQKRLKGVIDELSKEELSLNRKINELRDEKTREEFDTMPKFYKRSYFSAAFTKEIHFIRLDGYSDNGFAVEYSCSIVKFVTSNRSFDGGEDFNTTINTTRKYDIPNYVLKDYTECTEEEFNEAWNKVNNLF